MKNYYKLLGVDKKASKQQINAAFKRLSLQTHPDRNGGDEYYVELFKELNEAKQVLCSDERRAEHDANLRKMLFAPALFDRRHKYLPRNEQLHPREVLQVSKLKTATWLVTVVGLAVAIMFILIAIENASSFFGEETQTHWLNE